MEWCLYYICDIKLSFCHILVVILWVNVCNLLSTNDHQNGLSIKTQVIFPHAALYASKWDAAEWKLYSRASTAVQESRFLQLLDVSALTHWSQIMRSLSGTQAAIWFRWVGLGTYVNVAGHQTWTPGFEDPCCRGSVCSSSCSIESEGWWALKGPDPLVSKIICDPNSSVSRSVLWRSTYKVIYTHKM